MFIENTLGGGEQTVGGQIYTFTEDDQGRYITKVTNLVHIQCFLSVVHYREVKEDAESTVPSQKRESKNTDGKPATNGAAQRV